MATRKRATKSTKKSSKKAAKKTSRKVARASASRKSSQKRKGPSKGTKRAPSTAQISSPRLREQTSRDAGSSFPEDFHALYDRGFRSARGIEFPQPRVSPGEAGVRASVLGVYVH